MRAKVHKNKCEGSFAASAECALSGCDGASQLLAAGMMSQYSQEQAGMGWLFDKEEKDDRG